MRDFSALFFLVAASAVLAACGGGGGVNPAQGGASGAAPHWRPVTGGDSLDFAGGATQTFVRPLASPAPQPAQITTSTISQAYSIQAPATFEGIGNLIDYKLVEADAAPLQTITTVSDNYYSLLSSGSAQYFRQVGFASIDSNAVQVKQVYGSGNGLVDVLPEMAGFSWTNNAALTVTQTDPSGQTSTRTTNGDGSYHEHVSFPDGTTSDVVENADGSGTYSAPLLGVASVIAVGTPKPVAGGGLVIPISITQSQPVPTPSPIVRAVPDWYPSGAIVLAQESDQNSGPAPIPGVCNVSQAFGLNGNRLVQVKQRLDTIFGEREVETATTFVVAGEGPVCVQVLDTLDDYYDYSGQSALAIFSSRPQQITTVSETLGLRRATLLGAGRQTLSQRSGPLVAAFALASSRMAALSARRHLQKLHALHRSQVTRL